MSDRQARHRALRREQGYREALIWLSEQDDRAIANLIKARGLRSRSEAIEYALRQVFTQETSMTT